MSEDLATKPEWERQTIRDLLFASLKEQRRRRRWGTFFKLITLAYVIFLTIHFFPGKDLGEQMRTTPHTGLIDIDGAIFDSTDANADNIATGLSNAFKDKGTKGIILRINSPGGSPVQADYVFNEIKRQRLLHPDVKVYAVCTDLCASAAYYIAAAADQIYSNPSSLVGSIGVIFNGFGFVDTMKKLGIERRLVTAGAHKGFMDPFSPEKPGENQITQKMLDNIHALFIARVKQGRGSRLQINSDTFSGLIWTGNQAMEMGLIDNYGSAGSVARDIIKQEKIIDYTVKPSAFEEWAKRFGVAFSGGISDKLGITSHPLQ